MGYFKNRLFFAIVVYVIGFVSILINHDIASIIAEVLICGLLGIGLFDSSVIVFAPMLLKDMTPFNKLYGAQLWVMRYNPEKSYILNLSLFSFFELIYGIPLAYFFFNIGLTVSMWVLLITITMNMVLSVVINILKKNNSDYLYE